MTTASSFRCPCCGAVSYHPQDVEHGYCARCHWWTGDPELGPPHIEAACEARQAAPTLRDEQPIGLNCPECGELAVSAISPNQAFCGNGSCRILMWDPAKTREQMLAEGVHEVDLHGGRPGLDDEISG